MTSSLNSSILKHLGVSIYAIFVGSQVTEGVLLVPHWQSLSAESFYDYYAQFGPTIGGFYTILTITAALVSITVALLYQRRKQDGRGYALVSAVFSVLVILCFYIYFKSANELFYERAFNEMELSKELVTWSTWHWSRIALEVASLLFLMQAFNKSENQE